jgi:hypothetical protein
MLDSIAPQQQSQLNLIHERAKVVFDFGAWRP